MRKLVLFILMSISIFGYSQSQKISQLGRETTLTDSSLFLIGKWNSVNNFSSKAINVANLKTVLGGGVDTTALKTTGATYQHDSLYVDKLFVQSTGEINSNVYTIPTTSATNGINWSGMGVSIKSSVAGTLTHYVGSIPTFAVSAGAINVAGNIYADFIGIRAIGTSATPFGSAYVSNYFIKTLPTLDNANDVVLVRNATTGKIDYRSASTLTPSLATNYIGYGSGGNTVTGSPDFTWNNAAKDLYVNGDAHIGGVNGIARLNVTASATGSIFNGYDNAGVSRFQVYNDGTFGANGSGGNYFYWSSLGNLTMNSDGGYTPGIDLKRNGISELAIQTLYGTPRITFANNLAFMDFAGNSIFSMSDAYNYSNRKFNVNVLGNAMLNVKSTLSNGTSKIFEGYNSNDALKVVMSDEGSTWLGGTNGVAKLNITASGTGGASKILSGYDSVGATEKVSIYDNGDISTKGNVSTDITKGFIIGDGTDGSWQMILSGADFLIQKKESGVWITKQTINP